MLNQVKIIVKIIIEGKETETGQVHTVSTTFSLYLRKEGL